MHLLRDRLCVLQFSNGNGDAYLVQFNGKNYNAPNLKKLLLDPNRVKIFHFARFDLAAIKHYLGIELENIFCTKIASKLTRTYTDHHGLKELCREMLNVQLSKQQQTSNWGAHELTKEQMSYAASDVLYLHRLRERLTQNLEEVDRVEIAQKIFRFLPVRAQLDLMGWNEIDILAH